MFFKKLFGMGPKIAKGARHSPITYKDFIIVATPTADGAQYQCVAEIYKAADPAKIYKFIRADKFSDYETALSAIQLKAKHFLDEQGHLLFENHHSHP